MEKHIITISREFGSGGRTIGKLVAEHLGIQCYDAELIQKLAVESGFDESYIKEAGEYTPGGFLASAFTDRSFGPTNSSLFQPLAAAVVVAVQVLLSAVTAKEKLPCKTKKTVDSLPPGRHSYGLGTAG
ncbi:MAG: AAA family ATPase [Faecalibacterium sp.]